jgi:metal-dependent amidase/aminoacylase/carboxypeptidase family protein
MTMKTALVSILLVLAISGAAQTPASNKEVETVYPAAHDLYVDLHQNPELSSHEIQTASKLAARLRSLGYDVTEGVGGTGVVAILKNGAGPTIMLRTELDALPVEEKRAFPMRAKCTPRTMPVAMSP